MKVNFLSVIEDANNSGFFTIDDLKGQFPEKSRSSIYQSLHYYKKKGLLEKKGKKFKIVKKSQKPENMNDTQILRLTQAEMELFDILIEIKPKFCAGENRISETDIVSLVEENSFDIATWNSLKPKLAEVGIIAKKYNGGKKGVILSIDVDKLIVYLDNQSLIKLTPIGDDLSDRIKEIISKYRDKNEEILNLEQQISVVKEEIGEVQKKELKLQKELDKLNKKYSSFSNLEKIKSFSKVVNSIEQLPEEDLIIFFKEVFEE